MRVEPLPSTTTPSRAPGGYETAALPSPRTDLMVLSAAAYRALVSGPRNASDLAGTFAVSVADASGRISVAPGAVEGVVAVSIDLFHVPAWPEWPGPIRQLHLAAQLRDSWVARVAPQEEGREEQARQLADAITKLAQIPGQQTVAVTAVAGRGRAAA